MQVSTTRGRDGSIDIFVEEAGPNDHCIPELPKPLIVECKDHDDSGKDLRDRLFAGWRVVAERLARQAEGGWQGDYTPWRHARSYAYCVSARLPKPQLLIDLRNQIQGFFDSLPNRPPLEAIRVLDWSSLRVVWDGAPLLADRWLGVKVKALLTHSEQLERFTGFRAYLLEASLPFLAPAQDDPSHPDVLRARLAEPGRVRGLLLEGPGGVGKSRTLVEVAVRADAAGWRVLHAQAGEPALTDEELEDTVLSGSGPTLLVIDYLDQTRLDFSRLRQQLLPAATARGIHLALIANARSSAFDPRNTARDELFDIVPIHPTSDRARAIVDRLLSTVAPLALKQVGYPRLAELSGERPVVALFIAREIERRAAEGMLVDDQLSHVRSGDLTGWLRRRLSEDDLLVGRSLSRLEPASPGPSLVAAAAILAAAPQSEAALAAAGEQALFSAGSDLCHFPSEGGARLVSLLRRMGWLESRGSELSASHDVVADEVVYDVLADRPAALVRKGALAALLAPALASPRTLGRAAVALRRVIRMEGIDEDIAKHLATASDIWLRQEAANLGQMLARGDPVETSFALGAVVHEVPWADVAFQEWDALISPFLTAYADLPAARHFLYRGLSVLPDGRGSLLFSLALRWLSVNGHLFEASFVLGSFLRRKDITAEDAHTGTKLALAWLATFEDRVSSRFVLRPLLEREDLTSEEASAVERHVLSWLGMFQKHEGASVVLAPFLNRRSVKCGGASAGVNMGLAWLSEFGDRPEAKFVLRSLLDREDLSSQETSAVEKFALSWLRLFQTQGAGTSVLGPFLRGKCSLPSDARHKVQLGLAWLAEFGDRPKAAFVLRSLLERQDLEVEEARRVLTFSFAWLKTGWSFAAGDSVLKALLLRSDLTFEARQDVHLLAASRIREHPREQDSSHLLKTLLVAMDLSPEVSRETVAAGVYWLGENRSDAQADFVFTRLLRRKDLQGEARLRTVRLGVEWLRAAPVRDGRDFVLSDLLRDADLVDEGDRRFLIRDALNWLRLTPLRGKQTRFLRRALRRAAAGRPEEADFAAWEAANGQPASEFSALARDLEDRVRNPALSPSPDWIRLVLHSIAGESGGDQSVSLRFGLMHLLPLAARCCDPAALSEVCDVTRHFIVGVGRTPRSRRGFARGCYRLLDEGAWPDREAGEQVLRGMEISRPFVHEIPAARAIASPLLALAREAFALARRKDSTPNLDWLDAALTKTAERVSHGVPMEAGFVFPPLLPLVLRSQSGTCWTRLASQVAALLADASFNPCSRREFAFACYRHVDDGEWPDRGEAERLLSSLGIERPSPTSGD